MENRVRVLNLENDDPLQIPSPEENLEQRNIQHPIELNNAEYYAQQLAELREFINSTNARRVYNISNEGSNSNVVNVRPNGYPQNLQQFNGFNNNNYENNINLPEALIHIDEYQRLQIQNQFIFESGSRIPTPFHLLVEPETQRELQEALRQHLDAYIRYGVEAAMEYQFEQFNMNIPQLILVKANEDAEQREKIMQLQECGNMLGEYCIEDILKHLPLQKQVNIARQNSIICEMLVSTWRRTEEYRCMWYEKWRSYFEDDGEITFFIHIMLGHIEEIVIKTCLPVFIMQMRRSGIAFFPNVKKCTLNEHSTVIMVDDYLHDLHILVPNVRILHLITASSNPNIWQWENLVELCLFDNHAREYEINSNAVMRFCFELKHLRILDLRFLGYSQLDLSNIGELKNLEVFKCNLNPFKKIIDVIFLMRSLRTIAIFFDGPSFPRYHAIDTINHRPNTNHENSIHFFRILNTQAKRIVGIALDGSFMHLNYEWHTGMEILKYNKLRLLAFCCVDTYDYTLGSFINMRNLQTLSFRSSVYINSNLLLKFIENCWKLRHLDLIFCTRIEYSCLHKIVEILKRRGQSIILYFLGASFEEEVNSNVEYWFKKQTSIIFSLKRPPNSEFGPAYFNRGYQIDLQPLDEFQGEEQSIPLAIETPDSKINDE